MDQLQKAVLLCLDPTANKTLRQDAFNYCQSIRSTPQGLSFVLQCLSTSMRPEATFWCLQVVHELLSTAVDSPQSASLNQLHPVRPAMLNLLSRFVHLPDGVSPQPTFVLNKLAQVLVKIISLDYPHSWPDAFRSSILPLAALRQPPHSHSIISHSISMFFRLLRLLDDDVTSIRAATLSQGHIPSSSHIISTRVKDALRDDCIAEIVARCIDLMAVSNFAPFAFDIIARYVEWVDISLIVQERILNLTYAAITCSTPCQIRNAAAYALKSIIMKRMDTETKVQMLRALRVDTLLQSIPADAILADHDSFDHPDLSLKSGQFEVASLVNAIAMTGIDIVKAVVKGSKSSNDRNAKLGDEVKEYATAIAQTAIPLALRFLDDDAETGASDTLQCVAMYINTFAHTGKNGTSHYLSADLTVLSAILRVVEERAILPVDFDPRGDTSNNQDILPELRTVLVKTIFSNIARTFPELCVDFVKTLYTKASKTGNILQMELALALVVSLTGNVGENPIVVELRRNIIASPPACMQFTSDRPTASMSMEQMVQQHQLELVSRTYFDLVSRSSRLFLVKGDSALLSAVLPVFFDNRGLGHPSSESVRSQAAYSLLKLAKPLRGVMTSTHLETILNAASRDLFPLNTEMKSQTSKNQMFMFETIGYLLGTDHKKEGSVRYLSIIMKPMLDALATQSGPSGTVYISALGFLSKGFGGDSKPIFVPVKDSKDTSEGKSIGHGSQELTHGGASVKDVKVQKVTPLSDEMRNVWVNCVEVVLKSSEACMKGGDDDRCSELRLKLLFFLHRMVDTIGFAVVPYLEHILPQLLKCWQSAVEVRELVTLASQCVIKFRENFRGVCMGVYTLIVEQVHRYSYVIEPNTNMAVSEADREALDIHRGFLYFINAIAGSDLICVLVEASHQHLLQKVMGTLLQNAIGEGMDVRVAPSMMRMSLQTLGLMMERWCGNGLNGRNGSPNGFTQFVLEEIAKATIASGIRGVVFRHGNYETGSAVMVLTELVNVHRIGLRCLGDAFVEALCRGGMGVLEEAERMNYFKAVMDKSQSPVGTYVPTLHALLNKIGQVAQSGRQANGGDSNGGGSKRNEHASW